MKITFEYRVHGKFYKASVEAWRSILIPSSVDHSAEFIKESRRSTKRELRRTEEGGHDTHVCRPRTGYSSVEEAEKGSPRATHARVTRDTPTGNAQSFARGERVPF
ncbi:uncharacterized protein LOC117231653 [Bombus vosnesenskii]|uniref:Uncharacterized protein LOC117231653 n=1 Tax=Bombus vosnesenskii TaxID=207650 RepID=A0A6J3K1N1_9HYME|nr:uncharacterized protein LOC117231653 [Bombus vosnesenskii]